ncbi:MAG: trypsin-like peptidase domain-containing protein [Prevotellaceae bacterium]|nr:trypsin-like peptidase domain-containing protein [Prevotellaceae bacterium]
MTPKSIFLLLALLAAQRLPLRAQVSEGGTPPSFRYAKVLPRGRAMSAGATDTVALHIPFDVDSLRAADAAGEASGDLAPLNVAKDIAVNLGMANSGAWHVLENGQRVWQLTIKAPGAVATLLYYAECRIPRGGQLFVYSPDRAAVLGAYTSASNPAGGQFATDFVAGDVVTLEYAAPLGDTTSAEAAIRVEAVAYGYNHLHVQAMPVAESYGDALGCQVNVVCAEGDAWRREIDGTVRVTFRKTAANGGATALCSGAIVNNVRGDFTPYLLTAYHCISESDSSTFPQARVYFHYEYARCGDSYDNAAAPEAPTLVGAQLLVAIPQVGGSDGALLRLSSPIPASYGAYYCGWDATSTAHTGGGVNIHHPRGDVKKIATYSASLIHATWTSSAALGATNAHWRVASYSQTANGYSFPESGSSGSPLFNKDKRVVGTLTGGNTVSDCSKASTKHSSFGKLFYHWDRYSSRPDQQMKTYLDPDATGTTVVDGAYETATKVTVTFAVRDEQGNPIANATITLDSVAHAAGDYTFSNVSAPSSNASYMVAGEGYRPVAGAISIPTADFEVPVTLTATLLTGAGTARQPYLIADAEGLKELACFTGAKGLGQHFRLTADVELGGAPWAPLGAISDAFRGKLHGGGHRIKNMQLTAAAPSVGLFAALGAGACIDSLLIVGGRVQASEGAIYVGGLAGYASATADTIVVHACGSAVAISAGDNAGHVGGLVGYATSSGAVRITSCYSGGDISGYAASMGGVVGYATIGTSGAGSIAIADSYSEARITAQNNATPCYSGGVVGYVGGGAAGSSLTVSRCYAAGRMASQSAGARIGGIAGHVAGSGVAIGRSVAAQDTIATSYFLNRRLVASAGASAAYTLSSNYARADMVFCGGVVAAADAGASTLNGANKTLAALRTQATYKDSLAWDFGSVWAIREAQSYPLLQWQEEKVAPTPTTVEASSTPTLRVHPNPVVNGLLTVEWSAGGAQRVEVYSLQGALVGTYATPKGGVGGPLTIDISHLPAGTYIVKLGGQTAKIAKR